VLDNISIDFNINREELNKYSNEIIVQETINQNNVIELPIISDDENMEKVCNPIELNNIPNIDLTQTNNSNLNNIKCKQMTQKGKQCDYKSKPNSEYCGRHSK
jgi:hypothetical protein